MHKADSRDVVGDAVDAVTLNQDVQWERCARLATPAECRALDTLRSLARLFTGSDAARTMPVSGEAGGFTRRAVPALMSLAAGALALTLLLLPWRWDDYYRAHGDLAVYMTILLVGHGASAGLLLLAGRHDRRTWLLGGYFLFKATVALPHMLPAFWGQMPPPDVLETSFREMSTPTRIFLFLYALPQAYAVAPAFLWAFARECPRVHRRTRLDDFARRMVPVSVTIGCAMCASVAALYWAGAVGDAISDAVYLTALDAAIATPNVLSLAAVVVIALRAHTASAEEKRRVAVFSTGFLVWVGVATAYDVVEVLMPGFWLSNYQSGSVLLLLQPLRFPGMVLLWYSVLAVRVPHPREVIRAGYRRVLTRPGLLGAAAAAALAALGWLLASRPERAVGAVIADPLAQSLFVTAGILLLVVVGRERLLRHLDAWVNPDTTDQQQVLAAAAATLAKAEQLTAIGRTVARAVKRGCGSPAMLLVVAGDETDAFRAPDTTISRLPRTSAIAHLLETVGRSLRVHPSDAKSAFELLPPEDAAWVVETAADVIVPVPGPGAAVGGILVVGRRFDDRIVRTVDVPFLEVLASAAGQAVARLRLLHGPDAKGSGVPPGLECPACGSVSGADEPPACDCGSAYIATEAPRLLAGKLRLTQRLGAGGMGSVYLARDIGLDRDVAVKTLVRMSVPRLLRFKPEARAMATVAHPAVAQIYGVESWRGRPFLVMEFLPGGTLADRLRDGPVPALEAVAITTTLAEALTAVHETGYVHGDVKPSNIGFTAAGSPKLLDFGLARRMHDAAVVGGTLRYLSPEVLSGRSAEEADDVWSLCVVLYEMASGEHPFTGGGTEEVTEWIRRQRLAAPARSPTGSKAQLAVLAFVASLLTAPRSARPPSARACVTALHRTLGKD